MSASAITFAAFASLYAQCAPPDAAPLEELAGIAMQESGLRPWAIRDETTKESLFPVSRKDAERIAGERLARGHTIGAGLFQITHERNWHRHGLTVANAFDPCTNLKAGANHYADNLKDAARQLYNSGRINGAPGYAAAVRMNVSIASVRAAVQARSAEPNAAPCVSYTPSWAVGLSPRRLNCAEGKSE